MLQVGRSNQSTSAEVHRVTEIPPCTVCCILSCRDGFSSRLEASPLFKLHVTLPESRPLFHLSTTFFHASFCGSTPPAHQVLAYGVHSSSSSRRFIQINRRSSIYCFQMPRQEIGNACSTHAHVPGGDPRGSVLEDSGVRLETSQSIGDFVE
ncbi:hypothetical protein F5888DRAFT_1648595 [Russula emetica]|nr:hypothetical protein F5888DRAFT_1648595 [Russula emetica]